jgi:hypothetical protein
MFSSATRCWRLNGRADRSMKRANVRGRTVGADSDSARSSSRASASMIAVEEYFALWMNLRLIVDSQRLLTSHLIPYAERVDPELAEQWRIRVGTYSRIQRELRNVGGRLGNGAAATSEAASAVSRVAALPSDAVIEPRMLGGFHNLFRRLDARIADILEAGVERGAFVQRVTVPRVVTGDGHLVHTARERFVPVARATDLEVIRTAREHLRPRAEPVLASPGASRVDLHAALLHRPPEKGTRPDVPLL